jgi:hypothetical protein
MKKLTFAHDVVSLVGQHAELEKRRALMCSTAACAAHSLSDQASGLASAESTFRLPDEPDRARKGAQSATSTSLSEADVH